MDTPFRLACALGLAAALAGCAVPADTRVMGAAAACDLRVETRHDRFCAVQHVSPPDAHTRLTHSMREFEAQTLPR